jgi:mannosyltransferase
MKSFSRTLKRFGLSPYSDWFGVGLTLVLFMLLAWPTITGASAYFDEGYSAYLARFDPLSTSVYTAFDVHPPLYYFVLHIWQSIVGSGVAELRFLTVIFAWIAIIFTFLTIRRWFGRKAALLTIGLMIFSPLFIRYGSAMRMYTMALAITFAATYVLLRAVTEKDKRWWRIYTALVTIGMWTNYFMALVWVTHVIWIYWQYRSDKVIVKSAKKAYLWAMIWYVPWLPILIFRYVAVQASGFWIPPLSIETFTSTVTESIVFRSAADTVTWLAAAIVFLLAVIGFWSRNAYHHIAKSSQPAFRLFALLSSVPVVLLIAISLPPLRSAYTYRYALVAALSSIALIAVIVTYARFGKKDRLIRGTFTVFTLSLFILGANQSLLNGNRSLDTNWQNRTKQIMERIHASGESATVVARSGYAYYVARLYPADGYEMKFLYTNDTDLSNGATRPLVDHKDESIKNFKDLGKVWLVGDHENEVVSPGSDWKKKLSYEEHDPSTNMLSEAAVLYERERL